MTDIVIGSGPSGVAAAWARLAKGREVLILDGGKELEPDKASLRDRLAKTGPQAWRAEDRAAYSAAQTEAPPGQVRRFGSDFAMEPFDSIFAEAQGVALRSSRAVGGLSNLWGTAVLPFAPSDMQDWPITAEDLAPHYRAVQEILPIRGRQDALAPLFPNGLPDTPSPVPPTSQATILLHRFERRAARLSNQGLHVGMARQAVAEGCRECGMCLHGCPWGLMWSAAHNLAKVLENSRCRHRPGAIVARLEETETGILCHLENGETLIAERVFLASGVLDTARILLRSGLTGRDNLELKEARHGFLPMLQAAPSWPATDRLPLTTLPQLFAELKAPDLSPYLIHAQLYGWNEHYARDLHANYGAKLPGLGWLWPILARRLVVAQIFLHSAHWPSLTLQLAHDGRLNAQISSDNPAARLLPQAAQRLGKGTRAAGLWALPFALRFAEAGGSFHLGSSLPMARNPKLGQSDLLGRPTGQRRLHVVDASVLPAIPATTITYPVMANAHRIAALA
ncbi:MAG: GMC oxidoreductase [Mangrovicoccus sp.]